MRHVQITIIICTGTHSRETTLDRWLATILGGGGLGEIDLGVPLRGVRRMAFHPIEVESPWQGVSSLTCPEISQSLAGYAAM